MLKIVRNEGQCNHFKGAKNKFLLCTNDFAGGEYEYAAVRLRSLFGYFYIKHYEKKRGLI